MQVDSIPTNVDEILSNRFLGQRFECTCGETHEVGTRVAMIEPNMADRIPGLLPAIIPGERILLVADRNTWTVAGERLAEALSASHSVDCCLLRGEGFGDIHASVDLVDQILAAYPDEFDGFAAVGSGTVNDLTRAAAHRRHRPYFVFATAASMNGYTSAIVALLENGLKTTRAATPPVAVFADPLVLAEAPAELTLAGLGDLVSKPYCGCDWKIASLIKGEPYCDAPEKLLSESFARGLDVFPWLAARDPEAIEALFRLLLVSGLSMAISGTSSPASGAEHLLSHYWDMTRLRDGERLNLHGAQVGVGSLVIDTLYREIYARDFASIAFEPNPNLNAARQEIENDFGSLASSVWPQWEAKLAARTERDLEQLCAEQDCVREEIERTLGLGARVRHVLAAAGAPTEAEDLGISSDELAAAVRHGRKIRNRYTALDVAAEIGILGEFADRLADRGVR
ncbi:MAG: sn-glycerol-1-phosphate dehydrogenase [Acidobacteriota bacterium]